MSDSARQKWDARYRDREPGPSSAPGWLAEIEREIPANGLALDIAAGAGRGALWLARRGLEVVAADISPVGLAIAQEAAAEEGLDLRTEVIDFEEDALPGGPFDVVTCFNYRQRSLFPVIADALAPAGVVVVELPTVQNLERNAHPSKRWLAEDNELLSDVSNLAALRVIYYREGWFDDRHVARLVAQKR
ncbi:MAG: class I SAM-dependent methyltransferase [Deltaproteobacteria bacterium]|nr:MAG: class I SAM-dependent methyltransferase [Deltaproteobacteria bacterium]